ncbi:MAG TPA: hypothetical protein VFW47_04285 [Phenylobacterium sp.]|nr:hypothetical protein [Phenylobacterium sp.]
MKWRILEIHVDGVIHRASYRVVGDMVEVTSSHGQTRRPKGPFLAEIAAREALRRMIRRPSAAA